jgi:hypothetical protein
MPHRIWITTITYTLSIILLLLMDHGSCANKLPVPTKAPSGRTITQLGNIQPSSKPRAMGTKKRAPTTPTLKPTPPKVYATIKHKLQITTEPSDSPSIKMYQRSFHRNPNNAQGRALMDDGSPMPDITVANSTGVKSCNPQLSIQRGYCQYYVSCNRRTRIELKRVCSDGMYWNPKVNSVHGGICDYFRNLDNDTLNEYKKDPNCVLDVTYFRSGGECSGGYYWHHPQKTAGKEELLSCPKGLVWSQQKESCSACNSVMKMDGKTPCCNDEDYDHDEDY